MKIGLVLIDPSKPAESGFHIQACTDLDKLMTPLLSDPIYRKYFCTGEIQLLALL